MGEQHQVRFGSLTQAVNTYAAVALDGEGNAAGAVVVPAGVSSIRGIRVSIGNSAPVGTDAGVAITLRLSGNGLRDGQQDFSVGGLTTNLETTGAGGFMAFQTPPVQIDCDLSVQATNGITMTAAFRGVDVGTPELCVELIFA